MPSPSKSHEIVSMRLAGLSTRQWKLITVPADACTASANAPTPIPGPPMIPALTTETSASEAGLPSLSVIRTRTRFCPRGKVELTSLPVASVKMPSSLKSHAMLVTAPPSMSDPIALNSMGVVGSVASVPPGTRIIADGGSSGYGSVHRTMTTVASLVIPTVSVTLTRQVNSPLLE